IGETCILGDGVSTVAAGLSVTGLCVDPNRASLQQDACAEFLNSVRRYQVAAASPTALVIRPNLDEIVISPLKPPCHPASAHPDGGVPAGATSPDGGVGADVDSCPDTADDPTTANFTCESSYPGGGSGPRCLMLCKTDNDCRAGRVCVDFEHGKTAGPLSEQDEKPKGSNACTNGTRCFCADAPVFDESAKACFDQLISYQMNVGRSFIVTGSQSPIVTTAPLPPPGGNCAPNPTPDALFSFRIPMNAPVCSNVPGSVAAIDSRIDPDFATGAQGTAAANAQALVNVVTSTPAPGDPCLYLGGPVISDPTDSTATHVRALFQNSQLSFVLADLDRSPTTQFSTSVQVSGGFGAQVVQAPATVEVSMPARIILGPVDSLAQVTTGTAVPPASEAPYLFVVDQRRLGLEQGGGPTRGQLLRINPFGFQSTVGSAQTGYQPIFEDYTASGGLFPIQ
ncbi:MAG TPA: hypothetical protein VHO06_08960, partial [Polyangia bacterium]|nr:hypothetical protein [Polyangia bacterium]